MENIPFQQYLVRLYESSEIGIAMSEAKRFLDALDSKNEPQEIIQELIKNLIHLQGRRSTLEKEIESGALDRRDLIRERNEIGLAFQHWLEKFDKASIVPAQYADFGQHLPPDLRKKIFGKGGKEDIDKDVERTTPPPISPSSSMKSWLIGIGTLIIVSFAGWWFGFREKPPALRRIDINLYGQEGIMNNPLREGTLSISAKEIIFNATAKIDDKGQALFDAVPDSMIGKKIIATLHSNTRYRLKDPKMEYPVADTINIEIVQIAKPPEPTRENNDCPKFSPAGQPLDTKVYKPHERRLNHVWVSGHWEKINGECTWRGGYWKEITVLNVRDCPQRNAKTVPKPAKPNANSIWFEAHYELKDCKCVWTEGKWISPPPPKYTPPLQTPTHKQH